MKKITITLLAVALLAGLLSGQVLAQEPPECEFEYTVQSGDWLSKIADKYYGDLLDYVKIVDANNAQSDDAYTDIADPNIIEPGWVLCIPSVDDLMTALIEAAEDQIEAPPGLSPEQLANATYPSQYATSGEVTLENGRYSEPAAPGSASELKVRVTRHLAYGDLNGNPSAALVLLSDPGGSGSFYDLHVMVSQLGQPVNVASTLLGDRVQIKFITIADNLIRVNMITQGPDDPFCCPTQEVVQTYALENDQLILVYTNVVSGLEITPNQIRLDTQGLPYTWQATTVAEQPYTTAQPPGPTGLPEHIQILFGVTAPADRQPGDPIIYLIPADKYRLLWEEEDNDAVSQMMDDIFAMTVALPEPPPIDDVPALPFEEISGVNDVAVQLGRVTPNDTSASKDGYRFVGRFAQSPNPVTRDGLPLYYIYQGFTNDGQYLVSFFYPVTSAALPTNAEVSDDFEEAVSNNETQAFIAKQAEALNALTAADFEPNLNTLDALVASLEIDPMVSSGIQGQVWSLIGRLESNGNQTPLTAIDSQNYTIVYHPDGTLNFQADCNSGSNGYTVNGGIAGQIAVQPGPMTLAACPPGSLSDEMVATVTAPGMDYKVWPGGKVLELVKPAGGGALLFGTLGPAEVPPPPAQIRFWADAEVIQAGQCTMLHWEVENVQAVWVYPQGEPYQDYPMTGQESREVCPQTTTTFEMRVQLTDGNIELRQVTVQVTPVEVSPPTAQIAGPTQGQTGETLTFDGSASSGENAIVSYAWDFGNGTSATGARVDQVYNEPGSYNVTLTVTDDQGLQGSSSLAIQIYPTVEVPEEPVARINGPSQAEVGQSVTFDGSASTSGVSITAYNWDLGDSTGATGSVVTHVYNEPGTYTVVLVITDEQDRNDRANVTIQIAPVVEPPTPPTAQISGPNQGQTGQTLTFDGSTSSGENAIVSYAWNFGNGTSGQGVQVEQVYDEPGSYEVTLTVTDDQGLQGSSSLAIQIYPVVEVPDLSDLEGKTWTLVEPATIDLEPITALFQAGSVTGFSGCNTYSGSYQSDGSSLTISGLTTTQAACDEAATARENTYLANLGSVNGYAVQDNQLTLTGAQPLTFIE